MTLRYPEKDVIISGVGLSEVGRATDRSQWELTFEAIDRAVSDAGLTYGDIDGLATFPGTVVEMAPGFAGPSHWEIADALRLHLNWQLQAFLGAGQLSAVLEAILAVSAGLCRHAVVYRTSTEGSARRLVKPRGPVTGPLAAPSQYSWLFPIGALSGANHFAMYARSYMDRFGLTREQLGGIALAQRMHAANNPSAVFTTPISLEDYMGARMVSDPLCLLDCDVAVDASTAVIISRSETSSHVRAPVAVEAMSTASNGRLLCEQWEDLTTMASTAAAAQLWGRTDLGPSDLDFAQVYDGFSIMALMWIEALGLCDRGEAGTFVEDGVRIGPGGDLPVNTWGGQMSGGRLHGFGSVVEAVTQLRGEAGPRQVPGAQVGAVGVGAGHVAGALLLRSR